MNELSPDTAIITEPLFEGTVGHAFILLCIMVVAGIAGGIVNFLLEGVEEPKRLKWIFFFKNVATGIAAALTVPLFLQMIGSKLVTETLTNPLRSLTFLAFCLIAALSSTRFLSSISERVLNDARRAKESAREATESAHDLQIEQLKLMGGIEFQEERWERSLVYLDEYLKHRPDDTGSLWRKAYILKRLQKIKEAHETITKAISLEKDCATYYYNRACYAALLSHDSSSVVQDLKKALEIAPDTIRQYLQNADTDLDTIRSTPEFIAFCRDNDLESNPVASD
ncbi:YEATS-associated helix-containing protein [Marinobacterium stanieri]|uniref:YEATS-associated helix-containing protein n=1 Tax=Marinobacterium stanieri TaxID=49186 RepID=UPI003A933DF6